MNVTPSNTTHARLSPSSASRWLSCPPSVVFSEGMERGDTQATVEGRIAHEVAERTLRMRWLEAYAPRLTSSGFWTEDGGYEAAQSFADVEGADIAMLEHAEEYAAYILEQYADLGGDPGQVVLRIETRVDLTGYIEDGFGTADCHIYNSRVLHVIDYKYGKGVPVTAVGNTQMRLYALGILDALEATSATTQIQEVRMSIYQPRLGSVTTDIISAVELTEWGESYLRPRADMAAKGIGEFAAGAHCIFCPAKAKCRTLAMEMLSPEAMAIKLGNELSDDELGIILSRAETLNSWVSKVKDYALERAMSGQGVRGYKVVEGRSTRYITDEDAAAERMRTQGLTDDLIYTRKFIGITEAEKLIGKKGCASIFDGLIGRKNGRPTLVPVSDKRLAITPGKDFEGE